MKVFSNVVDQFEIKLSEMLDIRKIVHRCTKCSLIHTVNLYRNMYDVFLDTVSKGHSAVWDEMQ
jgi:hypothetical protein